MSGSERQLDLLIAALDQQRFHSVVVESQPSACRPFARQSLALPAWRKLRNVFTRYASARRLLALARKEKIDLVHCSYQWLLPYGLYVSRRLGIPVVLHVRRPGSNPRKLLRQGFASADAIVAISARIQRELTDTPALRDKVWRIDDAVAPEFFDHNFAEVETASAPKGNTVVFAMVARIEPNKHQMNYLEAARIMQQRGAPARFLIIGKVDDPRYYQTLQDYIRRHHLANYAVLAGERLDMTIALRSIDVLVSLAGGSVMYEAMASGKPVLSAGFTHPLNSVHVRDGETGRVITSRAPADIAAICTQLLDAELRQRLGQNAGRWAQAHLGSEALARKTEEVFEAALRNRNGR